MHFDLYPNRIAVMDYLEKQKVYTMAVTNLPGIYARYIGLDANYKYVNIALGFHPELAFQYQSQVALFKQLMYTTRYIGEIGLDNRTTDMSNRTAQRAVFSAIIEECEQASDRKILSIHSRRAETDVINLIKDTKRSKVILHWYSGSLKNIDKALELGCYFSINHAMIRSASGRKIVDAIPIRRILLESDAPFSVGLKSEYSTEYMWEIYDYLLESKQLSTYNASDYIKKNFIELLT